MSSISTDGAASIPALFIANFFTAINDKFLQIYRDKCDKKFIAGRYTHSVSAGGQFVQLGVMKLNKSDIYHSTYVLQTFLG